MSSLFLSLCLVYILLHILNILYYMYVLYTHIIDVDPSYDGGHNSSINIDNLYFLRDIVYSNIMGNFGRFL